MANVDGRQFACGTLMAVAAGAFVVLAFGAPQSVATSLVVSPATATRVAAQPVVAPAYYRAAGSNIPVQAQAPEFYTEAESDFVYNSDFDDYEVPIVRSSWNPLVLVGIVVSAAAAALGLARRTEHSSMEVQPVDLAQPTYGVDPIRFNPGPSRPSMALNAKKGIHPELHEAKVICEGEEVMVTQGTKKEYVVDIWSGNHPFYTKSTVYIANKGRLDKFKGRYGSLGKAGELGSGGSGTMLEFVGKKKPPPKKGGKKR